MDRRRPPIAWALVLPVAAAELLLLVATANRYGYHRDELYFRVAGRHPAWGYDDQPALTPLIGRFSEWLFGEDPRGLRVMSAVAMALVVVLAALIARELGAGRTGQVVAALAVAASGGTMAVGHLLSTTTFDVLVWVTVVYLVARLLGGGDERQWLLVGLVVGIGLENKHLVLLLVAALAVGCVVERRWELARTPWPGPARHSRIVLWLPNLIWQARHGWPQLELASKIGEEDAIGNRIQLLPLQVLLIGPLLAALWIAGLWWLLRRDELRPYRPLGLAYLALLAIALVTGGKPYYTLGLLLALFGAAGLVAERSLAAGTRRPARLGVAIGASAVIAALLVLPLVPVQDVHATPIPDRQRGRDRDDRMAHLHGGRRARLERAAACAASARRGLHGQLRRGRGDRPLRPGPRHRAGVFGPQRLLALRPTARRRQAGDRRSATTIPHRAVASSPAARSRPASTTASVSTTRSREAGLDLRDDGGAVVTALAPPAVTSTLEPHALTREGRATMSSRARAIRSRRCGRAARLRRSRSASRWRSRPPAPVRAAASVSARPSPRRRTLGRTPMS